MNESIMPYKKPSADLHRKSPRIFLISLAIALAVTVPMLFFPLHCGENGERSISPPPVIVLLQNIMETRQVVRTPAPRKTFIPSAQPIASDKAIIPDNVTIPDTKLDTEAVPQAPPTLLVPYKGGADTLQSTPGEGKSSNEFIPPKRINTIIPEYPEMASRSGIEGTVYLKLLVNSRGMVDSVEVQRGPKVFQKSAVDAARATKFTPARKNDTAVAWWVFLPFRFVIENNE
jgi:TonB family protein